MNRTFSAAALLAILAFNSTAQESVSGITSDYLAKLTEQYRPLNAPKNVDRSQVKKSVLKQKKVSMASTVKEPYLTEKEKALFKGARVIDVVTVNPAALVPPSKISVLSDPNEPNAVDAIPRPVIVLELKDYEIAILDMLPDNNDRDWWQVSGIVIDQPDSEVWFTLNNATGEIYGTIDTMGGMYKLVTREATQQEQEAIVFRLDPQGKSTHRKMNRNLDPSNARETTMWAEVLQHRTRKLAEIRPRFARSRKYSPALSMVGGDLGVVDLTMSEEDAPAEIKRILTDLGPLANLNGNETFGIARMSGNPNIGMTIKYHQVLDGIRLSGDRTIMVEGVTGKVTSFSIGRVYSESNIADKHSWISKDQAYEFALGSMEEKDRESALDHRSAKPSGVSLFYKLSLGSSGGKETQSTLEDRPAEPPGASYFESSWNKYSQYALDPVWEFNFFNSTTVKVNARTGELKTSSNYTNCFGAPN